ncbi:intracellular protein transport protein uso1-like isoform X2 [Aristolochia californica]|uniref:intracellular protein transport protein uso1-like isoform X2 n=1 Tax=Aristolochia californica TaxID=171875 RepID=UPI0035DAFFD0
MGFNFVYRSLQEVFPQVDLRILKVVAIEHSNNVDGAVEFILSEVLPGLEKPQDEAACSPGGQEVGHISSEAADGRMPGCHVESEKLDLSLDHSALHTRAHEDPPLGLRCPSGETSSHSNAHAGSHEDSAISSVSCARGGFYEDQLYIKTGNGEVVSLEEHQDPGSYKDAAAGSVTDEHLVAADGHNLHGQTVDDGKDPDTSFPQIEPLESSIEESLSPAVRQIPLPVEEAMTIPMVCHPVEEIHASAVSDNCKESGSKAWKNDMEESIFDAEMVQVGNESLSTSHSGQMISIDLLEEFITEAKEYKKILSSEMEVMMNMMREVELQEKAANEAKVEASEHAGEVYGEKSILATETRELRSRLLILSDKRDRSLSIINEIRENLNTRLAEAEALKATAEQEKLQKEESARKALIEQELLMDIVVQESKKIQEEAEENAKLRDFLVDRGRVVDMLQGEIAVICEDVKMLEKKVDSRLPIGEGLSSRQMSRALLKHHITPELSKSSETLGKTSIELSNSEHAVNSVELNGSKKERDTGIRRTSTDEEWYLFEEI